MTPAAVSAVTPVDPVPTVGPVTAGTTGAAAGSAREFRDTIGLFATGVTVLSAGAPTAVHAMTANAITSLSLDPMLLLVCVARRATMAAVLRTGPAGRFVVNILADHQRDLADWFAGRATTRPAVTFAPWAGGARLAEGLAAIACDLTDMHDGGDHWIVVGRVVAMHRSGVPRPPLVFFRGGYRRLGTDEAQP